MNYSFNQSVSITTDNPTTPTFPPVEERLHTLVEAMKTLAQLTGGKLDPHLEQNFLDCAANMLAEHNRQHTSSLCHQKTTAGGQKVKATAYTRERFRATSPLEQLLPALNLRLHQ